MTIVNQNREHIDSQDDLGFGLGLALTERLVERYGWTYNVEEKTNGRRVTLVLPYEEGINADSEV